MDNYRPRGLTEIRSFIEEYQRLPDEEKKKIQDILPNLIGATDLEPKYTYLIQSMHLFKIGEAIDPQSRFNSLKCNNPHGPKLICYSNMVREKDLQNMMSDYHVVGEWYELPPEKVIIIKGMMG